MRLQLVALLLFLASMPPTGLSAELNLEAASDAVRSGLREGAYPGAVAAFGTMEGMKWMEPFGHLSVSKEHLVTGDTLYDLASLTKVIGTTTVAMRLFQDGKLDLDLRLHEVCPEFLEGATGEEQARWRREVKLRHLLTHTSGLPSWKPFYKELDGYAALIGAILELPLEAAPGSRYKYSDPGMMLMGEVVSRLGGKPLFELEQELVFGPLGMKETRRNPPGVLKAKIAPTEEDGEGGFIQGVVHDENARAGQGLTGHAGLFSNVSDLSLLAAELLKAWNGEGRVFHKNTVRTFASNQPEPGDRGLGWQMADGSTSAGSVASRSSFGHTGFTGTSIWMDPENGGFAILLTNRVHPSRANTKLYKVRTKFADAAFGALLHEK